MYRKLIVISLFVCVLLPSLVQAADSTASAEIVALEIRNLSTSVDRLTRLLYDQAQQKEQDKILRKLDIAVAYLNFRSRRIEMLERDAQNIQSTKNRLEDIIRQWQQRLEQIVDLENSNTGNTDNKEMSREDAEEQLNMLKQRLTRVDSEIVDFDNQILELRNQLDDVEDFVEKHLEL